MLRVLPVCLTAFWVAFSLAPCGTAEAAPVAAWPAPSQHAPDAGWASSSGAYAVETGGSAAAGRDLGPTVGHGRLVSPQVWERYSRRPLVRGREAAGQPALTLPRELPSSSPVRRSSSRGRIVAKPAPKKTATATPAKNTPAKAAQPQIKPSATVGQAQQPAPAAAVSPAPAPVQPTPAAPVVVKKETTPPVAAEQDNISASWIIRRAPAPASAPAQAAPSPAPAPQNLPPSPAGGNAAGTSASPAGEARTPSGV